MEKPEQYTISSEMHNFVESFVKKMSIKNYTLDISSGSKPGDNYLGVIANVLVKGKNLKGEAVTLNLILKCAPTNEALRELTSVHAAYVREMYMYSKVLPLFAEFQEEKGILKPFKSFAKYYDATMGDRNEALIVEDMKVKGYKLCNRREPFDYNHVLLVMREYGKFHALSFALRDQKPELFNEISAKTKDIYSDLNLAEHTKQTFIESTKTVLGCLDPVADKMAYDKFNNFREVMQELALKLTQTEAAGNYAVITHGDCWMNNILFAYKDEANPHFPTDLCLIDWQQVRSGSPALDLSYFLFSATDKTLRDEHYNDMIQEYYNSLSSFLYKLGSDPEKMFPFNVLQEHLKKFSVYGLSMSTFVLHLITTKDDEIPDFSNSKTVDDVAEILGLDSQNNDKYCKRMRGVILDYLRLGYDM